MKQPIIGISPRFSSDANYQYVKINYDYFKVLLSRNATIVILLDNDHLEETLAKCDGFLIIGGDDIDPTYYHQDNTQGLSKGIDQRTDQIDEKIIKFAKEHHIPTLGICRGIQAMAAFLNGSLYQDMASSNLNHLEDDHKHFVKKVANTKLSSLLPDTFLVNSFHHQCVKDLPDGFIATFVNNDVIEAIEHQSLPLIGVQWHPERYYTNESIIIFDYFFSLINKKL